MIECLEEKWENANDDDVLGYVEDLGDCEVEEIKHLDKKFLIELCKVHGIETSKKKKKSLIEKLTEKKIEQNKQKKKKQLANIEKLEMAQRSATDYSRIG